MSQLHPTLWRTCRVIANKTRLELLWLLFRQDRLCVSDLAAKVGISDPNASIQLRALSARGLITPQRNGQQIFYCPEVNINVEHAETLLGALRECHEKNMAHETVIRQATAFTHAWRIKLVRALDESRQTFSQLLESTEIPAPSLSYHLTKLRARNFIARYGNEYRLKTPNNSFGRVLMKVARS